MTRRDDASPSGSIIGAIRRAAALVALALAAACWSEPAPCDCPSPAPAPTAAPLAPSAAPTAVGTSPADAGCPAPVEDENPYCSPGEESYGAWTATPEEVVAAARKLRQACAPVEWLVQAIRDCMARLGRSNVRVLAGVYSGDRATERACVIGASSVEWQGRRWITFYNDVRDGPAFFGFTSAIEMKPSGPVQVTVECQGSPTANTGPYGKRLQPEGWKTFPKALQERLCAP